MKRFALILALCPLVVLAACDDEDTVTAPCPVGSAPGPGLSLAPHLVLTHSLGETWTAIDLNTLEAANQTGLTGQAPNDLEKSGTDLYVVNSIENSLSRIDGITGSTLGCIQLGASTSPYELEIDPADSTRGWLTTWVSGEIIELDLATATIIRRRSVEPTLQGLCISGNTIAVTKTSFNTETFTYGTGYVILLRKSDLSEIARFEVPTNPQFVFEGADQRLHVVCTGDYGANPGQVVRIESDFSAVRDTLNLGGAPGRAILAPDGVAYLTAFCDGLLSYDTVTFTLEHGAANALLPGTCAGDVAIYGSRIYVADFSNDAVIVFNPDTEEPDHNIPVGDGPNALVVWIP